MRPLGGEGGGVGFGQTPFFLVNTIFKVIKKCILNPSPHNFWDGIVLFFFS